MLRPIAKTCVACAYTWSGASRIVSNRKGRRNVAPFIIGYHRVVEDYNRSRRNTIPSMLISTAMLERHIDWIAKRYEFVTLDEIGSHLESQRPLRKPVAAITFDDGYSDVYHYALPLLTRKGIPAAVFVVSDVVGTSRLQIFDRLYLALLGLQRRPVPLTKTLQDAFSQSKVAPTRVAALPTETEEPVLLMNAILNTLTHGEIAAALDWLEARIPLPSDVEAMAPLTWDMVRSMHAAGMTIGSHTAQHCLLSIETVETVRSELIRSKQTLEGQLGIPVDHFAYPDGRFTPAVIEAVKEAGYKYAYGTCQSGDSRFPLLTIPRKVLWERSCLNALQRFSASIMNCHANWLFDNRNRCEHNHGMKEAV